MTGENRKANALAELARADRTLQEAETLVAAGLYAGAVSRAYYCAFHAAHALLVYVGLQPRTHRGVHALLEEQWVRPGHLEPEQLQRFGRLMETRSVADYGAIEQIDGGAARALVADARAFVAAARARVEH